MPALCRTARSVVALDLIGPTRRAHGARARHASARGARRAVRDGAHVASARAVARARLTGPASDARHPHHTDASPVGLARRSHGARVGIRAGPRAHHRAVAPCAANVARHTRQSGTGQPARAAALTRDAARGTGYGAGIVVEAARSVGYVDERASARDARHALVARSEQRHAVTVDGTFIAHAPDPRDARRVAPAAGVVLCVCAAGCWIARVDRACDSVVARGVGQLGGAACVRAAALYGAREPIVRAKGVTGHAHAPERLVTRVHRALDAVVTPGRGPVLTLARDADGDAVARDPVFALVGCVARLAGVSRVPPRTVPCVSPVPRVPIHPRRGRVT